MLSETRIISNLLRPPVPAAEGEDEQPDPRGSLPAAPADSRTAEDDDDEEEEQDGYPEPYDTRFAAPAGPGASEDEDEDG